jgi:hypothetical protein
VGRRVSRRPSVGDRRRKTRFALQLERGASILANVEREHPGSGPQTPPVPPPLAPLMMMIFWALLGSAAGIKLTQSIWQLVGWTGGEVSVAVPVGGAVGAICGALLGLITSPRMLVLLMAVFSGSSAGSVAGQLPWATSGGSAARSPAGCSGESPGRRGCTLDAAGVQLSDPERTRRVRELIGPGAGFTNVGTRGDPA